MPARAQMKGFFTRQNLLGTVKPKHGDLALLVCCFVTGLLDAASFNNWEVFVGMQTGNTIILGLSTARLPSTEPYAFATTLVSISCFFLGALTTAQLSNLVGPLRRATLMLNFFTQALLLVLAAALTSTPLVPAPAIIPASLSPSAPDPYTRIRTNPRVLTALPPAAFQSGMQIATSRVLGFAELPTVVLTSGYADLAGDRALLAWRNPKRNRRLGAVVLVLLGAVCSAWLQRGEPGLVGVMWIAAGIKGVVAVGVGVFMERAEEEGSEEEKEKEKVGKSGDVQGNVERDVEKDAEMERVTEEKRSEGDMDVEGDKVVERERGVE